MLPEALLLLAFFIVPGCTREPGVTIHTQRGEVHVPVEVARTPAQRMWGLMYRKDLAPDAGMLFLFPAEEVQEFWMKNTPLPLDMIFIDRSRRVAGIAADAKPFTLDPRGVGKPSQFVLEVHAGFAARNGIQAGDQVEFTGLDPAVTE